MEWNPELVEAVAIVLLGLIAGILDYSAGVGFGIAAAPILVAVMGEDPRSAAMGVSLAQLASAIPVLLQHGRKRNIEWSTEKKGIVALIGIGGVLGSATGVALASSMGHDAVRTVFALALVVILPVIWVEPRGGGATRRGSLVPLVAGVFAGVEKAFTGGGFSPLLVAAQRLSGIGLKEAIALAPAAKMLPLAIISLGYAVSGYGNLLLALYLALGSIASAIVSPGILRAVSPSIVKAAITLTILYAVARTLA
ncbi:MAG: sulfite exporter TauE/SafE family protein [Desulfurococcales archaeon]|nr:sulfite exporter TauE/SafE family protein [Desulfurococcales archaeon]